VLEDLWWEGFPIGDTCDDLFHLGVGEAIDRDFCQIGPVAPTRLECRTTGQYRQDAGRRYLLDHQMQQLQGGWVRPVEVFDNEQYRVTFCVFLQDCDNGFKRFLSLPLG
jgi:hypothetical protein